MQQLPEREDIYKAFTRLAEETQTGLRLDECKRLISLLEDTEHAHSANNRERNRWCKELERLLIPNVPSGATLDKSGFYGILFVQQHHRYILRGKMATEAINVAKWVNRNMDTARHTKVLYQKGIKPAPQPTDRKQ